MFFFFFRWFVCFYTRFGWILIKYDFGPRRYFRGFPFVRQYFHPPTHPLVAGKTNRYNIACTPFVNDYFNHWKKKKKKIPIRPQYTRRKVFLNTCLWYEYKSYIRFTFDAIRIFRILTEILNTFIRTCTLRI